MNRKKAHMTKVMFALLMMLLMTFGNVWVQKITTVTMNEMEKITSTKAGTVSIYEETKIQQPFDFQNFTNPKI